MNQGVLEVRVLAVDLQHAKGLSSNENTAELKVGVQKSVVSVMGRVSKPNQSLVFAYQDHQTLQVYVYPFNTCSGKVVYGQIKLRPLVKIPNTKHFVTIYTVYMHNGAIVEEASGSLSMEIVYSLQLAYIFQITIENASLYRNTEAVGEMDPYVQISLDGVTRHTKTKSQAGKNPVWNETFVFHPKNVSSKLFLKVKDQDVTTSDLVGVVELAPRELGLFRESNEWTPMSLDIIHEGKVSGKLEVATKFQIKKSE